MNPKIQSVRMNYIDGIRSVDSNFNKLWVIKVFKVVSAGKDNINYPKLLLNRSVHSIFTCKN
jgi:hypothetical protein